MVLKLSVEWGDSPVAFYSSVILNGTETVNLLRSTWVPFYSSVILNGTETRTFRHRNACTFYSSVILNGTETSDIATACCCFVLQ